MNKLSKALLGGTALATGALLAPVVEVEAQQAPGIYTTQTANRPDAAQFYAQAAAATSCTTSQASAANLTITITPPAGNYVYITGFYVDVAPNATAASSATAWSTTNMPGNLAWATNVNASSASAPATEYVYSEVYPTGLKSVVAGTAVTIVPSATTASTVMCPHVVGYFNPS
jgi:hypothetical protein